MRWTAAEPKPVAGKGQASIRIHAAGVNFIDIYHRRGSYPLPPPFIPGLEAVGEKTCAIRPGDRVAYTGHIGSYSEYAVVDAVRLIMLPSELSFIEGAAFPLQGMTAQYLIHEYRMPRPGERVLIHAAAGGVGLLLAQWAKHLGATVIGAVSTEAKAAAARAAGADHVILCSSQDFAGEAKRLTDGQGAGLILDGVGKTTFAGDLDAVAARGHIVVLGSASGPADPVAPHALMAKSFSLSGGVW